MGKGAAKRRNAARKARNPRNQAADKGALPQLSTLSDLPSWGDVVPRAAQELAFAAWCADAENPDDLVMGCVCRLDRGFPAVLFDGGVVRAEHAVGFAKEEGAKPAVGDWVVLRVPQGHDMAVIEAVLPRFSDIARWRGRARGERQTLAANVDVVLVAQPLGDRGVSLDRMARSAVIARDSGCAVAVVLTKADRAPGPEAVAQTVADIHSVLGEVPVAVCAAKGSFSDKDAAAMAAAVEQAGAAYGIGAVASLVPERRVGMVLGESGVGKSTLLNAILGRDALETGAVRSKDDAGRHTTVSRRMVKVPGEGVIIDCPGLRSLPLVGHERGLREVFPAISAAAQECRFNDCTHDHEPDCAVRGALDAGSFSAKALDAYLALAAEMRASAESLDPDVRL